MGIGNKLLQAAAGNAAGEATYVEDVFSTYLYTGNGGTQNIENGIALSDANSGGSVEFDGTGDYLSVGSDASFGFGTGDFTMECWIYPLSVPTTYKGLISTLDTSTIVGVSLCTDSAGNISFSLNSASASAFTANSTGQKYSANAWQHIAITRESGTVKIWLNGLQIGTDKTNTGDCGTSDDAVVGRLYTQFDNYYFDGYISNSRIVKGTALYTSNFTPSTTPLTAVSGTSLLTCQGTTIEDASSNAHTITVNGDANAQAFGPFTSATEGKGGLVWVKLRDNSGQNHALYDTERGVQKRLDSDRTVAEYTETYGITSFNANGWTTGLDSGSNYTGLNYASWTFAKQEKFFDVVTWTGDGTGGRAISHNLGSIPGVVVAKATNASQEWFVYHRSLGNTKYLHFNTDAAATNAGAWNNTTPTATEFTGGSYLNVSGRTYVAYLFAHNNGDGIFGETGDQDIIKCGSYTGNGTTSTQSIDLGFEPQWLLVKNSSNASYYWWITDTMRGMPVGANDSFLYTNASDAEVSSAAYYDLNANGFNVTSNANNSGETYIYIAIRRGPMKTPESGTEVFAPAIYSGTDVDGRLISSGFPVDSAIIDPRNGYATPGGPNWFSRLTGNGRFLQTAQTSAELDGSSNSNGIMGQDGITVSRFGTNVWSNVSGNTYVSWFLRRAPGFFDVVAYTGTGVSGLTVNHNLGVVPELIIGKSRNSTGNGNWPVLFDMNASTHSNAYLNITNGAFGPYTYGTGFLSSQPTATELVLTLSGHMNYSGDGHIAYLFATVPGVSKVGSYTGNGTSQTIDCGFSAGARFVLIKRTDSTGDWHVYDSERGIVAGNDPRLELNTTDAEDTGSDDIDPVSSGFSVTNNADVNTNSASYIFLAIA